MIPYNKPTKLKLLNASNTINKLQSLHTDGVVGEEPKRVVERKQKFGKTNRRALLKTIIVQTGPLCAKL